MKNEYVIPEWCTANQPFYKISALVYASLRGVSSIANLFIAMIPWGNGYTAWEDHLEEYCLSGIQVDLGLNKVLQIALTIESAGWR